MDTMRCVQPLNVRCMLNMYAVVGTVVHALCRASTQLAVYVKRER